MLIFNFKRRKVPSVLIQLSCPLVPHLFIFGRSIKLEKIPQTLIIRIFATIEKLSFFDQILNTM
jgi:hypothetical protein